MSKIIDEARKYLGVPWTHCGRSKEGVDCIGLIMAVGLTLRILPDRPYPANYRKEPDGYWFQAQMETHMLRTNVKDLKNGDVLLFRTSEHAGHVGFYHCQSGVPSVIHAYLKVGKVTEHLMSSHWWSKVVNVYRFPLATQEHV